jgi:heme exporter protein A
LTPPLQLAGSALACRRGGREIFAGVNFVVASGEALAVTGRNGAGKSSLLRMIAGLLRIATGEIALTGGNAELSIGEQAHYLGHQDALKGALTVRENLDFWTHCLAGDAADDALARVGLEDVSGLPAAYLSAGQRRRLSLARLVAVARPLWLLDEPASALDTAARATLAEVMQVHLAAGGLIVAATHTPLPVVARELRLGAD